MRVSAAAAASEDSAVGAATGTRAAPVGRRTIRAPIATFAAALRRLTRVHARSVEQPSNPDDLDDFFNWPWLVAGEMGDWKLTDAQAKTLREYLLRGGFIYMDDFWNDDEWERFVESMTMVFPDRQIVEIDNNDAINHTVYDLDERYQILGMWSFRGGMAQRAAGTTAHWRGIYDDQAG